ncbi:MAG TPA: chorismate mutase [Eubacteriaceae bacterium]|jgi:chorismate mutase/prephenate dehydratase|nr:chorismate mutase [Eubacteriaceae bacterium]
MDELTKLREEIDEIDRHLVSLFESRMEIAIKIGQLKKKNNLPILNTLREQEVIELALNNLKNPRFKKPLEEFFKGLLKVSKEMQV